MNLYGIKNGNGEGLWPVQGILRLKRAVRSPCDTHIIKSEDSFGGGENEKRIMERSYKKFI